jgi:hypothetical protein
VAKGIEYGVNLLGCFIEGYVGSNQALGKEAEAHFGKMTQAALDLARMGRQLRECIGPSSKVLLIVYSLGEGRCFSAAHCSIA